MLTYIRIYTKFVYVHIKEHTYKVVYTYAKFVYVYIKFVYVRIKKQKNKNIRKEK
jgi:hypothetical protein